ncbi:MULTISPECIES: ROK family protein [unclassified Francisella]|uniref:ROK family protein n=1 Tax=unclassified Francisella TaxID=2610885 RepID=UPI002E3546C0|nr:MULTISPECIES: ROK family protein [unclassified Francisella]MED7818856.1 ROK family protein [Francisella sp. 19S2-4]MED7829689.1 ROK family protein [Francisella sp. 19S2-10]
MMKESMINKTIVGVDIGGTKINAGRIVGDILLESYLNKIPETAEYDAQSVIDAVIDTISKVFSKDVEGIGVGIPSVADREKGIVYDVQNIKSWKEIHLKEILEREFKVPVFIDNDANCFAIGQRLYGKGKQYENFVGITIGTGIGGGIINNGSLLKDYNCGAGEFGMLPYLDGILEDYCSGQFFIKKIGIDGTEILKKAKNNDKDAIDIYKQFGKHLGVAIKSIMYTIDPEVIILAGSIISAREYFENTMWEEIQTFAFTKSIKKIKIEWSETAGDFQIFGAAAVYLDRCKDL